MPGCPHRRHRCDRAAAAPSWPWLVRSRRRPAPPRRHPLRRARHRRRHHRRRRGPRRRLPGLRTALVERDDFASGTSSKSSKLVHGGLRYLQQGDVRLVYEALAERQRLRKNAPHLVKVLPFLHPGVRQGRRHPQEAGPGARQRHVDVRPHRRRPHRQAPQAHHADEALAHMPTLPARAAGRGVPLLRRPGRRRPAHAHPRPHRGARLRRRGRQRRPRRRARARTTPGRAIAAPTVEADGDARIDVARRRRGQRGGRVDRRRARARRGHPPRLDPPGQGHPHHRAVGEGPQRHRRGRARAARTSARSSWCRGATSPTSAPPTPTTTARSTTRSARPRTSSTCSRASTTPSTAELTEADIVGTWAGLRPLVQRRRQRAHRRPVPPPPGARRPASGVVTITGGKLTTYREMAADTVDEVRRDVPRRPTVAERVATHSRTQRLPLRGAEGYDELLARGGHRDAVDRRASSTWPTATAARPAPLLRHDRARPRRSAEPLVPGSPTSGPRRVYAARYEMARCVDDVLAAAHPGPPARPATPRPRRPPPTSPRSSPPTSGWDDAEQARAGRGLPRARRRTSATAADLPETAPGVAGRPTAPSDPTLTRSPAMTASPAARRSGPARRPRRSRSPAARPTPRARLDGAAGRRCPTRVLERLRGACATVSDRRRPRSAEASRDWWPLAMTWAARRPGRRRWPRSSPDPPTADAGRRRAAPSATRPRIPVTAAAGRSGVCGASVPALRRRRARPVRPDRHPSTSTTPRSSLDVLPGTFGDHFEHELRTDARRSPCGHWPQSIALSTVGGWLACRGAGQLSTRYGKIEDMVVGLDVVLADGTHRSTPAATPARPSAPTSTRSSSAPRARSASSPAPACGCTRPPRTSAAPPTASPSFVDGLDACRRILRRGATPAVCASTTPSRPTAATRPATAHVLLVLDEGDPGLVDATMERRRRGVRRRRSTLDVDAGRAAGWSTATTWPRSRR